MSSSGEELTAAQAQLESRSKEICPDPFMWWGGLPNRHELFLEETRSWRDWFQSRSWLRCRNCFLREEFKL